LSPAPFRGGVIPSFFHGNGTGPPAREFTGGERSGCVLPKWLPLLLKPMIALPLRLQPDHVIPSRMFRPPPVAPSSETIAAATGRARWVGRVRRTLSLGSSIEK
jgi:hypothetical protein